MGNTQHDEAADWQTDQESTAVHPAGEMALTRKTTAGARARALAGMALAVGSLTVVTITTGITTISHDAQL